MQSSAGHPSLGNVKLSLLLVLLSPALFAQSATTEYRTDVNGNRVAFSATAASKDGGRTLITKGADGREIPLEKTESRVISDGPGGKVVETIVRRFGNNGQVVATEKTVTESHSRADGGSTVSSTIYNGDANGGMQLGQKNVVETRKQGNTVSSEEVTSRAGADGRLQPVEKRSVVKTGDDKASHEEEAIYRVGNGGQFFEAARNTKDEKKNGDDATTQTVHFEPDVTGRMTQESRKVTETKKAGDGTEVQNTTVYAAQATRAQSDANAIREQQTVVRKKAADGSVVETTSLRQASVSDPSRLGDSKLVSETVCKGNCGAPAASSPAAAPAAPKP